jgi:hypothetical protein
LIELGTKRYKSKVEANLDICENCFKKHQIKYKASDFFTLENQMDEDILHEYLKCNVCKAEPIVGPRFKCTTCEDVDICQKCFDARLLKMNLK